MTCLSQESVSCVRAGRDFYIFHLLMVSIAQVHFWHRKDMWYMLLLQKTMGAGLEEAQAGIKISGRNINNLRYADDTTLMAESKELKSLLMKVKEGSENVRLKLSLQKTKIMASGPSHHFMANRWGNSGNSEKLYFFGLQNHCRW